MAKSFESVWDIPYRKIEPKSISTESYTLVKRGYSSREEPKSEPVNKRPKQAAQKLNEVASFTESVVMIYANASLSTREKGRLLVLRYYESLERLRAAGELTPRVEQEFRGLAESSLRLAGAQNRQLGESLTELIQEFEPNLSLARRRALARPGFTDHAPLTAGEKLSNWWGKKFLPWWQDDSW